MPRVSECVSPLEPKGGGGGATLLRVRGWGTQFCQLERKPGTVYSVVYSMTE
jgi:hypothetical protein